MKKSNFYIKLKDKFTPIPKAKSLEDALEYVNALKIIKKNNYEVFTHKDMIEYLEKQEQKKISEEKEKANNLIKNLHPRALDICRYLSYDFGEFVYTLKFISAPDEHISNYEEVKNTLINCSLILESQNSDIQNKSKYYAYSYWDGGAVGEFCDIDGLERIYMEKLLNDEVFNITVLDISKSKIKEVIPDVKIKISIPS